MDSNDHFVRDDGLSGAGPDGGMDWPSVSVVVATYQRRDVVCATVEALTRTCYSGSLELIVVVDGSSDGTAEALAAIDCPFPYRIVEQSNRGASAARNRGAAEAAHDILLFLDDDMISEPELVREHARFHVAGAGAVIGNSTIDPGSPPGFLPRSVARWLSSTRMESPLSPFDIFTGQLSVRRTLFEKIGGFDPSLTSGAAFGNEDADFGVKLLACCEVRYNPAAITRQRYVVKPRDYMERAVRAATADVRFIRKHPPLAGKLFELKGARRPLTRFVYRPLALIPVLPEMLAKFAVALAEAADKTPFRSNRALARFFSGARSVRYWSALRTAGWTSASGRLLVLCYHAIEDQSADAVLAPYGVPQRLFLEHLDSLVRRRFTFVGPDQLAAFLDGRAPLPRRAVLLTFDDGYANLLPLAREVLQPRGIEALVFAVTGIASGTNEWDQEQGARPHPLLKPAELKELSALGVEIGAHSRTHRPLPALSEQELRQEIQGSRDDLVAVGLPAPRFFAFPYAARDAAAKQAARDAGFKGAFGPAQRRLSDRDNPFDLPRVLVLAKDRGWRFRLKTRAPALIALTSRLKSAVERRAAQLMSG